MWMIRATDDDLFRNFTAPPGAHQLVYGTVAQSMADGERFVWRNVREGLVARRSYQPESDNTYRLMYLVLHRRSENMKALN